MRTMILAIVLAATALLGQNQPPQNAPPKQPPDAQKQAPTEISADLGRCSALFHVTDLAGNPLYDAKVHILIRYGFLNKRKTELSAGTNAQGEVKFVRLPNEAKNGLHFDITYGEQKANIIMNPATWCNATYSIPLKTGN